MEPMFTTALAAVSAASASIKWLKERAQDCSDIKELSSHVLTCFEAQSTLNKERNKKAGVGDISFKGSIDAVLESKKLAEELNQIRTIVNLRFPKPAGEPSTWDEIQLHYQTKLREQKEAQEAARKAAARRAKEIEETIKTAILVTLVIGAAIALFVFLMVSVAMAMGVA